MKRNLPTQRDIPLPPEGQPGSLDYRVDTRVYSEWQHGPHIDSLPKEPPQEYSAKISPLDLMRGDHGPKQR